jgi:hypothetical protein
MNFTEYKESLRGKTHFSNKLDHQMKCLEYLRDYPTEKPPKQKAIRQEPIKQVITRPVLKDELKTGGRL